MSLEDFSSASQKLYKYQRQGIDQLAKFLSNSVDRAALLADPPGAGKTPQAIFLAEKMQAKKVLVICPASLRENWRREFAKWTHRTDCQVIASSKDSVSPDSNVVVVSYSGCIHPKLLAQLLSCKWDMLICDESHYLKNPSSHTARIVLISLWSQCTYRLLISGTPLPNGRASEAWTTFSRLNTEEFSKWSEFAERFCIAQNTRWGLKYNSSKNLDKLQQIARDTFMVRRTREVCLAELPGTVRQNIYLSLPQQHVFSAQGEIDVESIIAAVEHGLPLESDHITTARQKLGELKAIKIVEHIGSLLDEVEQVVVFCHHRIVYQIILQALIDQEISVVGINGTMSPDERQKSVDDFQNKKARVFLGSIKAANTGITLTAASTLVMAEYDWVPSTNEQAEGRINRVTQKEICRVQYLVIQDSLDEKVLNVVQRKQREIRRALEQKTI
jgi:SWI/SNF-related matrix-associated actin-dependent regulator 1 of chromatin subfamily A